MVNSSRSFNDPFELIPAIENITSEQVNQAVLKNDHYLRHIYKIGIASGRIEKSYDQFKQENQNPERSKIVSKNMAQNTTKNMRATAKKSREDVDRVALMACFCGETIDNHHEILMWAHYAEGYKGLRIAFDSNMLNSPSTPLIEMKYSKDRLRLNPIDYWKNGIQSLNKFYGEMLTAKSSAWAYENEYRWLVPVSLCKKDGRYYYVPIDSKAIIGIDCGVQCSEERISYIKKLVQSNLGESTFIRKTVIDDYEYKLKYIDSI